MSMTRNLQFGALAITTIMTLSACESSTTGKSGLLEFRYSTDDDFADFNKPIAVGAKLDLRVYKAGTAGDLDATVESATSEDENILKIAGTSGNTITLEATGDGSAELEVTAKLADTGESVTDAIDMMARVPEVVTVSHLCLNASAAEGYYLKNSEIYLPFEMKLKDGQNVIGYGYYPVQFDNEAITLSAGNKSQSHIKVTIGETSGESKLSSELDTTTALTLNIVEEGQIDGALLDGNAQASVGQHTIAQVSPTVAGKTLCQAKTEFTVETTTTDICDVKRLVDDSTLTELAREYGYLEVEAKSVGDCKFTITYPKGNAGQGATVALELPIQAAAQPTE